MKEQIITVSPVKHSTLKGRNRDKEQNEVLWIADMFQITPAGKEQLQKVAQPQAM